MSFRVHNRKPQAYTPPPPREVRHQPTAAHSSVAQDVFQPASVRPTTLRNEVLGDGRRNCLEAAAQLAGPKDSIVLLNDGRDSSGHALVLASDGSVRDPNTPEVRYETLGQWLALHPHYSHAATVAASQVRSVLEIPPGPARDEAIGRLGLDAAARIQVADGPSWVTITAGTNVRADDGRASLRTSGAVAAQVLESVQSGSELDQRLDRAAGGNHDWYRVRLATGEVGYVATSRTTPLTRFTVDPAFSGLEAGLGAPLAPASVDGAGNFVQPFERGRIVLRSDGVRVVEADGSAPREVPPAWRSVSAGAGFFDASGVRRAAAAGNEPVLVLRQLSDAEDNALDRVANGTWYQVRRQDGTTAYVYETRLGDLQAHPSVAGLAAPQLGKAVGPLLSREGGGFVQQFERGAIAIDAQGNKTVTGPGGEVLLQVPSSTVTSLEAADAHHLTQRGRYVNGVLTGNTYNNPDEWDGYNDCGPTSVVIAASLVGAQERPPPDGAWEAIDHARDLAFGWDTGYSRLTGTGHLVRALQGLGATATTQTPSSLEAIDAALARGNPVIAGGAPFASGAWGATTEGYLERGGGFLHWVVVSGRTNDGYIINDPLSENGPIVVTREQLEAFLRPSMGMVEVSPSWPSANS